MGAKLRTGGLVDLFPPAPLTPLRSASGICDLKGRGEKGRQRTGLAFGGGLAGARRNNAAPGHAPICETAALLHLRIRRRWTMQSHPCDDGFAPSIKGKGEKCKQRTGLV